MNQKTIEILGSENTALLSEFLDKIKGKSINEIIPLLSEFKKRLPEGKSFTPEEKEAILEEALNTLPESEKNKYKAFLKTMRIM